MRSPGCAERAGAERVDRVELDDVGSRRDLALPPRCSARRRRLGGREQLVEAAGVVALHEHARRRRGSSNTVTDAGRHVHALEQVEVHAGVVRDRRLDRVGVADTTTTVSCGWSATTASSAATMRACISRDRLAAREARARRRDLHDLPLVGLGEVGDLAAGPLAVVGLDHAGQRAAPRARGASAMRCAVCVVRSIGLAYTAAIGSAASRSPRRSACSTPFSDRSMPGHPAREQRTGLRGDRVAHEHERASAACGRLRRRRRRRWLGAVRRRIASRSCVGASLPASVTALAIRPVERR